MDSDGQTRKSIQLAIFGSSCFLFPLYLWCPSYEAELNSQLDLTTLDSAWGRLLEAKRQSLVKKNGNLYVSMVVNAG